jgi:hypothetical protein
MAQSGPKALLEAGQKLQVVKFLVVTVLVMTGSFLAGPSVIGMQLCSSHLTRS